MDFFTAVSSCFRKYADFSGRARRSEFWFFLLFYLILYFIAVLVDPSEILAGILSLILLLPSIAVGVRRLHDIDLSGWWYLLTLIPLVNLVWVIYYGSKKGTEGPNRFGDDPFGGSTVQSPPAAPMTIDRS